MSKFDHFFEDMGDRSRFEPKLTVERRCQILAFLKRGTSSSVLAEMFGVSRRTVHDIGRPNARVYRSTRDEYDALGRESFEHKYLNEDLVREVTKKQRHRPDVALRPDPVKPTDYNSKANRQSGRHATIDAFGVDITVFVMWGDLVDGQREGWYYRVEEWGGTKQDSVWSGPYYTSSSALDGAKQDKTQVDLERAANHDA